MKFELTCCGKVNPIGTDREHLRLNFSTDGNQEIVSYEIRIASSLERLRTGDYDIGSFRKKARDGYLLWPDKALFRARTRYYWQVAAVTEEGNFESEEAYFETGIDFWTADWVCSPQEEVIARKEFNPRDGNIQNFRKEFQVTGEIEAARLYICGLGYFNATLNDKALDDVFYKPPVTDYSPRGHPENEHLYENSGYRTTFYTYDAATYLKKGKNILSVDVANGYYCNTDKLPFEPDFSFGNPRLVFELYITENGKERLIKSDTDTLVRSRNMRSTLYQGDFVDFTSGEKAYRRSIKIQPPMGKPVSPVCQGDLVEKIFFPVKIESFDGGTLYDFGVNHSGGIRFTAEAEEDAELRIRYAEVLDEDGTPNYETSAWHSEKKETEKYLDVYQENRYILQKGKNEIAPLFSWYCYRYVWIKNTGKVRISNLQSLFIHTDAERNGHFSCSEESLNRINEMFIQTLFCNMHSGLVTDCPHREKLPYTGDGNLVMKASLYNLDTIPFYYKWIEDILDAQTPEGLIPNSAPYLGGGGGYAWGNAVCFVTKYLFAYTGDIEIAERGYRAVIKWLAYYETKRDEDYVVRSNSHTWMLGDWLAPDTVASNVYYISTVCYLQAVDVAIFLAELLSGEQPEKEQTEKVQPEEKQLERGQPEEEQPERGQSERKESYKEQLAEWQKLKERITAGINKVFFNPEKLSYGNGVQGEDVLALAAGIVPKQYEEALQKKVEHHYTEETEYHLDTGIVLTPILIEYLTDHGYREIAWRIMTAKSYPSYYSLMENETTFSEHWSKKWPDYYIGDNKSRLVRGGGDLSHCHPMYGSVVSWLYERVAGLDLSLLYQKKVQILPYFTDCLAWAKADKILPYGKVSVEWENTENGLTLQVVIPKGLTGICRFPSQYKQLRCTSSGKVITAENGIFQFELQSGTWIMKAKRKEVGEK